MPTATIDGRTPAQQPKSSIYIDPRDAEVLRELASELGLVQTVGGGARYQAGSLSALMRFLAHGCRSPHTRPQMLRFLTALQAAQASTSDVQQP